GSRRALSHPDHGSLPPVQLPGPRPLRQSGHVRYAQGLRRARGKAGGMTMEQQLITEPDAASVATRAAGFVADRARAAVAGHGMFTFAVSGGKTPWVMFADLASRDLPWASVKIYQVDERIAPDGDPGRNLTHLSQ